MLQFNFIFCPRQEINPVAHMVKNYMSIGNFIEVTSHFILLHPTSLHS
ncbi:hypothetical protein VIBNISO65_1030003 [Vibrio nigripulchritudo SO65]|nr:hypothetical protein VIBNIAM115_440041 [Vibrio nigripulchritudo AM115]CCN44183.1 hypothetical protein VIBNIFTn2_710058 [Vibrio nigripulchritudo FTn2]CCN66989.1 hypothetical protein VIBNIPon4_680003 [Vibrio nigripulchritudo POn4]CCN74133.1 hypothetical protein VIBNISO65_1030003 [Vibrio nigripulchritudo SO65]